VDFLIPWMLIAAFIVVPGLLNYYATRRLITGPTQSNRWEYLAFSFMLSFLLLTIAALVTLFIALGWHALRVQIADFVRGGLRGYAANRPFAEAGVLTLVAVVNMAVMTALGWLGVPARCLK
jgi:hypothetical protein